MILIKIKPCGELLALTWEDVDFAKSVVTINKSATMTKNRSDNYETKYVLTEGSTKNQKARMIQITVDALNAFRLIYNKNKPKSLTEKVAITRSGKTNTTTNLEKRMNTIYKHAGFGEEISGLHILRRTFVTKMYEEGSGRKEIAGYLGDLEDTVEKYYIAARKKVKEDGKVYAVVPLPTEYKTDTAN